MIGKRVTIGVAMTVAVLLGLCLSVGMATAALGGSTTDANPIEDSAD
jgi:hypothetical protein